MSVCIPKGYNETLDPKISSDALKKVIFTVDAAGNFSACRSKASALLQGQGKGNIIFFGYVLVLHLCYISHMFI